MVLSDLSVKRPVLATVASLLLIAFGLIAFRTLPLRELPAVDPPIVSISTQYRGASAEVVETRITQLIEDQLSGIEGVSLVEASSRDGRSSIRVEFSLDRNLDDAANDVRAAVGRVQGRLPAGVDPPQVDKADADGDPIIWLNLTAKNMSRTDLTDFAERVLVDRLAAIEGVANVRVGGGLRRAMRVWLDPEALAARGLTADDVDAALRNQNVELPAGQLESKERDYTLRIARGYRTVEDFRKMPVGRLVEGRAPVRLEDVARVEVAPEDDRRLFRGNGENQVGLGVVRQSNANALAVARAVKAELAGIERSLPEGIGVVVAFDSTVFIEAAINKVWETMAEAVFLTLLVIYLFLGSFRAALIPAATIPVCLIATFAVLALFGFSINLITILALVLSIGLVVDDAIVVLENAQRRVDLGEPPLIAAQRGAGQVAFAVIATTAVLVSVFTPLLFTGGFVGRLFVELAVTVSAAVVISAFVALTLSPMMCSLLLRKSTKTNRVQAFVDRTFEAAKRSYRASVEASFKTPWAAGVLLVLVVLCAAFLGSKLPRELTPREDRGAIIVNATAPEGAGFEFTRRVMTDVEQVLQTYVASGEATRVLVVAPRFQDMGSNRFNGGFARVFLAPWGERREGNAITDEMNRKLGQIPGAQIRAVMQGGFGGGPGGGGAGEVSVVLAGGDYAELAAIAERVLAKARGNEGLVRARMNYEPIAPRVEIVVDREKAAALGVSVQAIGRTLEATTGLRRVGTFPEAGEEYDVLLQTDRRERRSITDLERLHVRSDRTGELVPLASVVTARTLGGADDLPRVNKLRAVTIQAGLAKGYSIGQGLDWLETAIRAEMKPGMKIDYTGQSKQFLEAGSAIGFAFALAIVIVFLVLAAQFESFVHPLTIILTVPLAIGGGLFGLYAAGFTLNIYSQIGLIILVALAAKNGILIVEFANQLRDEGVKARDAIVDAAELRLRPILMTSIATVAGAVPLAISSGAGAESRAAIGVVIVFGVLSATALTLYVVPVVYDLLARWTGSPEARARQIEAYEKAEAAPVPPAAQAAE
jgi:multidrug efflux pump